jgi:hypothetical protein
MKDVALSAVAIEYCLLLLPPYYPLLIRGRG